MNCSPVYKYVLSIFWNIKDEKEEFFLETSCFAYSSTPKMEEIYSSETSADFRRTTRYYIREDRILLWESQINLT
jgi:uncharacterized Rmd1/YagE family protein